MTNNTLILDNRVSNSSIVYEGTFVMSQLTFLLFSSTNMCSFLASTLAITFMMSHPVGWFLLNGSILL